MPKKPTERALLSALDDAFLDCRADGHSWRRLGFYNEGGLVAKLLVCARCGTEKRARYRRNGERDQNRYAYPDGYQVQGLGHSALQTARALQFKRAEIWENEDDMLAHVIRGNGRGAR